ncbi:uncharacterized protein LOC134816381 [Bolinopsis microptera]|uniref:uncharacterized protein LOC134816381 n=1 Tax=Bolinopsis microptera TaxID=2820187 RepID=UPI00307ABFDE
MSYKGKQKRKQSSLDHLDSEIKSFSEYLAKGEEIKLRYCDSQENRPIMLPPAPKQSYIDCYPDLDSDFDIFASDKHKQSCYETEVLVYRALEQLDDNIIVLHNFEYSHHQYRICDKSHIRKDCSQCKGKGGNASNIAECDFIVMGKNYFIIIEVKSMHQDHSKIPDNEVTRTYKSNKNTYKAWRIAQKQIQRTKCLIDGIIEQFFEGKDREKVKIVGISAFPSTPRLFLQTEGITLCKEDFKDFGEWWQTHILDLITSNYVHDDYVHDDFHSKMEKAKAILLAIWCTDKNQCDELKCSLGHSIMAIDEDLRRGMITYASYKNRSRNPSVIEAPDIISNFVGIKYLTAEQFKVLNSDQNLLFINGPAGSGKTVIMLGKILQLALNDKENKVVLVTNIGWNSYTTLYESTFKKAGLLYKVVDWDFKIDELLDKTSISRIVILKADFITCRKLLPRILDYLKLSNAHVFIDDCQGVVYRNIYSVGNLLECFKQLSEMKHVWITCDLTQTTPYSGQDLGNKLTQSFIRDVDPTNIVPLSLNLRNTCDVTNILSILRGLHIASDEDLDIVLPVPKPGHFIHGTRTVIHVISELIIDREHLVVTILNKELDKLTFGSDFSLGFEIGIIYNGSSRASSSQCIEETIDKRFDSNLQLSDSSNCYSAEWPAVIVIHDFARDISALYLEISRARVHCVVILFSTLIDISELDLLSELNNSAKIIRY